VLCFIYYYAECYYAECRYAECRGAIVTATLKIFRFKFWNPTCLFGFALVVVSVVVVGGGGGASDVVVEADLNLAATGSH
jgi:hypothetical protein